jgi:large repetitive protein
LTSVDEFPSATVDYVTTNEDTPVTGSVSGNDTPSNDGGNVWSKQTDPAHGVVIITSTGGFTYTPEANFNGSDSFIYKLCDIDGDCDTAIVKITVLPVDDFPLANADYVQFRSSALLNGDVSVNDQKSGDGGNVWTKVTDPAHGTVTFYSGGSYSYISAKDYIGPDSFVYKLCDADNDCDTAIVKIDVFKKNEIPVAVQDNFSTWEDYPFNGNVGLNDILSNDGINTWQLLRVPKHGTATISKTGDLKYIPEPNYFGYDSVWYYLCDPDDDCVFGLVTILVISIDEQPLSRVDYLTINEDASGSGNVAANDSLSQDGGNNWSLYENPAHGKVTMSATGSYTYTPDANFNGYDSFIYHLCDADFDCDTAIVKITVLPVNDLPIARGSSYTIPEDTPFAGILGSNDVLSGDGGNVYSLINGPSHGTITMKTDGNFSYLPALNYNGNDNFTVKLCDVDGDCATSVINITITPVNDLPFLLNSIADNNMLTGKILKIPVSAVKGKIFDDADVPDVLTMTVSKDDGASLPSFITWSADTLMAKPTKDNIGCYNIRLRVTDPSGATATHVFKICVSINTAVSDLTHPEMDVNLYPNPTAGKVMIEFEAIPKNKTFIQVFNQTGQMILHKEIADRQTFIDLSGNSKGIYNFRIISGSSEHISKIVLY